MKTCLLVLIISLTSAAYADSYSNDDKRCACSDYYSNGMTLMCEGKDMQFFPSKRIGLDEAKRQCAQAMTQFLKTETRIVCKDPQGSSLKAELTFNSIGGNMRLTTDTGVQRDYPVFFTNVSPAGLDGMTETYQFEAYDHTLNMDPPFELLEVYPKFYDSHDMDNRVEFLGYFGHVFWKSQRELTCSVDDIL